MTNNHNHLTHLNEGSPSLLQMLSEKKAAFAAASLCMLFGAVLTGWSQFHGWHQIIPDEIWGRAIAAFFMLVFVGSSYAVSKLLVYGIHKWRFLWLIPFAAFAIFFSAFSFAFWFEKISEGEKLENQEFVGLLGDFALFNQDIVNLSKSKLDADLSALNIPTKLEDFSTHIEQQITVLASLDSGPNDTNALTVYYSGQITAIETKIFESNKQAVSTSSEVLRIQQIYLLNSGHKLEDQIGALENKKSSLITNEKAIAEKVSHFSAAMKLEKEGTSKEKKGEFVPNPDLARRLLKEAFEHDLYRGIVENVNKKACGELTPEVQEGEAKPKVKKRKEGDGACHNEMERILAELKEHQTTITNDIGAINRDVKTLRDAVAYETRVSNTLAKLNEDLEEAKTRKENSEQNKKLASSLKQHLERLDNEPSLDNLNTVLEECTTQKAAIAQLPQEDADRFALDCSDLRMVTLFGDQEKLLASHQLVKDQCESEQNAKLLNKQVNILMDGERQISGLYKTSLETLNKDLVKPCMDKAEAEGRDMLDIQKEVTLFTKTNSGNKQGFTAALDRLGSTLLLQKESIYVFTFFVCLCMEFFFFCGKYFWDWTEKSVGLIRLQRDLLSSDHKQAAEIILRYIEDGKGKVWQINIKFYEKLVVEEQILKAKTLINDLIQAKLAFRSRSSYYYTITESGYNMLRNATKTDQPEWNTQFSDYDDEEELSSHSDSPAERQVSDYGGQKSAQKARTTGTSSAAHGEDIQVAPRRSSRQRNSTKQASRRPKDDLVDVAHSQTNGNASQSDRNRGKTGVSSGDFRYSYHVDEFDD
ncbi:hypothetical protein SAMN06265368_3213 [Cohaesibacter gelatinilyticus]|uniref:Uncharacterized protein n=1 Tax=Cohaesibacter gelatinilyticus TaxID=372072 RepID=A0A285PEE6_9HYPH|nr:hypothetical protein SAMN06265368_3213 [Cohaesibacter gelatinilyticus]